MGSWSACSTSCDPGSRTRAVQCKQRVTSTVQTSVSASRCAQQSRPDSTEACNVDRPCARWQTGDWSQVGDQPDRTRPNDVTVVSLQCSVDCGRGQRTRQVLCVDANDVPLQDTLCGHLHQPRTTDVCDMGSCAKTWFFSEWSSEVCGWNLESQTRHVLCYTVLHAYMYLLSSFSVRTRAATACNREVSSARAEVAAA